MLLIIVFSNLPIDSYFEKFLRFIEPLEDFKYDFDQMKKSIVFMNTQTV